MRDRRLSAFITGVFCAALLAAPAAASAFGPIGSFASYGEGAGQFTETGDLAVASDGRIYQAGYGDARINVFSPQGEFISAFGAGVDPAGGDICTTATGCKAAAAGGGAGALSNPEAVAFDSAGSVYVADSQNNRISVFTAQGGFQFAFGEGVNEADGTDLCTAGSGCLSGLASEEGGGLNRPSGLAVIGGNVYVADSENNRISVFSTAGSFLYAFGAGVNGGINDVCAALSDCQAGTGGSAAGEISTPTDVAGVPGGLAISANGNDRVDVFTEAGGFVRALGAGINATDGSGVCTISSGCKDGPEGSAVAGALGSPAHLAYDGAAGVYVGDVALDRVSQFNLTTGFIRAFGAGVVNGATEFQICTAATGCLFGLEGTIPGATPDPYGVAVESAGTVLVAEEVAMGTPFSRIERFGEPPLAPVAAPLAPSNKFKFGKLKRNKKAGTATLTINVPGAGNVVLKGTGIKKVKRVAKKGGKLRLPVKLKGKAKSRLLDKGKAKVTAKVTFTPVGGSARTQKKPLTLKKTLP